MVLLATSCCYQQHRQVDYPIPLCLSPDADDLFSTLEETLPKNIATCIKNLEFLDFFFRRLRRVNEGEREILRQLHAQDDYPFVSPCGPELNFVRPADLPIVFHSINDGKDGSKELVFGGSMVQPFCPDRLAISRVSGRLYHELIDPDGDDGEDSESLRRKVGDRSTPLHKSEEIEYGLIRSSVAVLLSDSITVGRDEESETHSGMDFVSSDSDTKRYPIEFLALHAEPGPWKLPFIDGDAD